MDRPRDGRARAPPSGCVGYELSRRNRNVMGTLEPAGLLVGRFDLPQRALNGRTLLIDPVNHLVESSLDLYPGANDPLRVDQE